MESISSALRRGLRRYVGGQRETELRTWRRKHAERLLKFKDVHKGEDCFIIGNGPSLNKMDLAPLRSHHTFGLNKIYLLFSRTDVGLSYHVAVNSIVVEQSAKEFELLRCPSFLSYGCANGIIRPLDHIYFLATDAYYPTPYSFYSDVVRPITEGYTVTYVAMQLAFYMGFSRVFLIGVDHSFTAVGRPNEERLLIGTDQNHFDPRYFGDMKWHLPDLEASEMSYRLAKFFFNRDGREIYNATVGGKLDVFPRVPFEQALAMCSNK